MQYMDTWNALDEQTLLTAARIRTWSVKRNISYLFKRQQCLECTGACYMGVLYGGTNDYDIEAKMIGVHDKNFDQINSSYSYDTSRKANNSYAGFCWSLSHEKH